MSRRKYTKTLRVKVATEAASKANAGMEHIIAEKYGLRLDTVIRWRDQYLEHGEVGLSKGNLGGRKKTEREEELEKENAALREEVAILKKAAAFLANVGRE